MQSSATIVRSCGADSSASFLKTIGFRFLANGLNPFVDCVSVLYVRGDDYVKYPIVTMLHPRQL
jgi:hypothetical protein